MKLAIIFLYCVYLALELNADGLGVITNVNVINSSVPDIQYDVIAVQRVYEATTLYPSSREKQVEALSYLFNDSYPVAGGWKVSVGCSSFFNPSTHYYINLNVTDDKNSTIVRIFD